ncbi:hypothetical protein M422DRAFT_254529 [Sphaerobolus stellatus SS14]|uniref:RRM domain-containing protein n=1 Tax=Sphaerobolus stellatus (strain SS14) TaxID=990650 RepID=A0A0C9V683_SPHS4|nr:hypothetical protein M422DRAFT_254529 [Sphaerobolus stellatus SS14]
MQYPSSLPGCHCHQLERIRRVGQAVHVLSSFRLLIASHFVLVAHSQLTWHVNRTTNVYINGLPPHFKAEQLYALALQLGTVLNCRTFTCQLFDHPSGYDFVLYVHIPCRSFLEVVVLTPRLLASTP